MKKLHTVKRYSYTSSDTDNQPCKTDFFCLKDWNTISSSPSCLNTTKLLEHVNATSPLVDKIIMQQMIGHQRQSKNSFEQLKF